MNALLRCALLPPALTLATAASAASLPFNASYNGTAQVVEVVNPVGPVLRFETTATGNGPFDLLTYFSTDVINMATGVGSGSNRFVAGNGDQLFGSFSVQVIPTAVPNIVDLSGQTTFTGGTGLFSGATGNAAFTGTGVFTSETSAISSLVYSGSISLVPEPASALLLAAGIAALGRRALRHPDVKA